VKACAKLAIIRKLISQSGQDPVGAVGFNPIRWQCFARNQLMAERDALSFIEISASCAKLFRSEASSNIRLEDTTLPHQRNQFTPLKNVASHLMNYRKSDKPVTA